MSALPLGARFRRLIRDSGPISLQLFMGEANARYYASRDPLGTKGDFITAPEISQIFGELVGLWLTDAWHRAGRPQHAQYVELGPGRGTLARDALRAMAQHGLAPDVHFVEGSPALAKIQQQALPQARIHVDLSTVPADGALLLVANEFLDALPVRQIVRTDGGWRERMVACDDADRFIFVAGNRPMDAAVGNLFQDEGTGTIVETCPGAAAVVAEASARLAQQGGAALFIDYGHAQARTGSTLQAVRAHRKVDPFSSPGEADLTAHVDFATLAGIASSNGARWLGTQEQGAWLRALGIEQRTAALAAQHPQHGQALQQGTARLVEAQQMGSLFKVMGLAAPNWPAETAGFPNLT